MCRFLIFYNQILLLLNPLLLLLLELLLFLNAEYDDLVPIPNLFKKSHVKNGFIEPAIYFTPSIGISEILYFEKNSFCNKNERCIWASSLRANSIYLLSFDENKEILSFDNRIHLKRNRIRDIDYDQDLNLVILLSENVPSIITLEKL